MKNIKLNITLFTFLLSALIIFTTGKNYGNGGNNQWLAPAFTKKLNNPIKSEKGSLLLGKKLFTQNCVTCHGDSGVGDGPGGKYLGKKVADLTSDFVKKQTDGEIYYKITKGRSPMPAFNTILKSKQRWAVINYLRTLK